MYIPGLTEVIIVKGFTWIASHLTASALAHIGGYIVSHGVISTLTAMAPLVITGSFVVGGIMWTAEKARLVAEMLDNIKNGNIVEAAAKIVQIANILHSSYDDAANAIGGFLKHYYGDTSDVHSICLTIKDIARKIN